MLLSRGAGARQSYLSRVVFSFSGARGGAMRCGKRGGLNERDNVGGNGDTSGSGAGTSDVERSAGVRERVDMRARCVADGGAVLEVGDSGGTSAGR